MLPIHEEWHGKELGQLNGHWHDVGVYGDQSFQRLGSAFWKSL